MWNFVKSHLDVLFDKLFDATFVFIGVFFAFFFNKCQQDKMLKEELYFNLSQIMRELPDEEPESKGPSLNLILDKNDRGECSLEISDFAFGSKNGLRHLNVILNRGLGGYLDKKDVHILMMISTYYEQFIADFFRDRDLFYKSFLLEQTKHSQSKKCLSPKEVSKIKESLHVPYVNFQRSRIISEHIGWNIYNKMKDLGVVRPKTNSLKLDFEFSIGDEAGDEEVKGITN